MNLLVIDLDGTITKSDSLIGFSYYMILKEKKFRFTLVFPLLLLLKLKLISNVKFKIWYSYLIFKNQRVAYLKECAQSYVNSTFFEKNINVDVLKFINQKKDYNKIILSANYAFIVEIVASFFNIENYLSVNLETVKGKYNGSISGKIPYGKEKVVVLSEFFSTNKYKKTIGLGDSKSDLPLLKYLEEGYWVSVNKKTNKTFIINIKNKFFK